MRYDAILKHGKFVWKYTFSRIASIIIIVSVADRDVAIWTTKFVQLYSDLKELYTRVRSKIARLPFANVLIDCVSWSSCMSDDVTATHDPPKKWIVA